MSASDPIDFYFDFSSPYGYFAAVGLEDVVAPFGRTVRWHPILIGVAMQTTGAVPLANIPVKGDYMERDCSRLARFMDVPWVVPEDFPISTANAARAFYAIDDNDPAQAITFAKAAYRTYFGDGKSIQSADVVADIAASVGADRDAVLAAIASPEIKARLKAEIDASIERGVFGSPFVFVDDEPFWGSDRFWMIKRWLKAGGW
jgi:2-hydroxychromene-2-carboxylate isomerase